MPTALSMARGWGSGSHLRLGSRVLILTNEHVARVRAEGRTLAHQFDGQDDIRPVVGDHAELPSPLAHSTDRGHPFQAIAGSVPC